MAQPITCDLCNAELAVMLVSNLGNGDTLGVGAACVHAWSQAQADATRPPKPAKPNGAPTETQPDTSEESGAERPRHPRTRAPRPTIVPTGADDTESPAPSVDAAAD